MCYDEGTINAYLDGEVDEKTASEIAEHVSECVTCAASLARIEEDRAFAKEALSRLEAAGVSTQTPSIARDTHVGIAQPAADTPPPPTWLQRVGWVRIAAAAVVGLFAVSLTLAPVRSLAADFLKVFRANEIQSLSLTAEDISQITSALETAEGSIDLASLGEVDVTGAPSVDEVSLEEAQSATDFEVLLPDSMAEEPEIFLQSAQTYRFSLNVDGVNELLAAFGSDQELPAELDGREFTFDMPTIVTAQYPTDDTPTETLQQGPRLPLEAGFVTITQGRSPELIVPDGVDTGQLRDVLVSLPVLPDNVRDQLRAVDDWQHTLLVPVQEGTSREITVNGTKVLLVLPDPGDTPTGGELPFSAAMWNDGGVIRSVEGTVDESAIVQIVESMTR